MVSIYFLFNLCQVKRKCRGNMKVDSKPSQRWSLARLRHITWRDVFGSNKNMSEREKGTEASDECFPMPSHKNSVNNNWEVWMKIKY